MSTSNRSPFVYVAAAVGEVAARDLPLPFVSFYAALQWYFEYMSEIRARHADKDNNNNNDSTTDVHSQRLSYGAHNAANIAHMCG